MSEVDVSAKLTEFSRLMDRMLHVMRAMDEAWEHHGFDKTWPTESNLHVAIRSQVITALKAWAEAGDDPQGTEGS